MRTIKFRAWLKIEHKMRKCQKIEFDDFGYVHTVGWFGINGETLFNVSNAEVRRTIELMQFTGLKDKNGKEIYEGDIMEDTDIEVPHRFLEVVWDAEMPAFQLMDKTRYYQTPIMNEDVVIGNIYENSSRLV